MNRRELIVLGTATAYLVKMSPPKIDPEEPENTYGLPRGTKIWRALRRWFRVQREFVLGTIRTIGVAVPESFPALTDYNDPMASAMTPIIGAYWDESGKRTMERVGLDADQWQVTNPHTAEKIQRAAFNFCQSTNATTSLSLNNALARLRSEIHAGVVTEGESVDQLTKRVQGVFDHAEKWRARRIAATEASRAVHAAELASAEESGVVVGFELLVSGDCCPLCLKVATECNKVRLGQAFAIIGDNPDYSTIRHPPIHPGCQCSQVPILSSDYGGPEDPEFSATLNQPQQGLGDTYTPPDGKPVPKPEPERVDRPLYPHERDRLNEPPPKPLTVAERIAANTGAEEKRKKVVAVKERADKLEAKFRNVEMDSWNFYESVSREERNMPEFRTKMDLLTAAHEKAYQDMMDAKRLIREKAHNALKVPVSGRMSFTSPQFGDGTGSPVAGIPDAIKSQVKEGYRFFKSVVGVSDSGYRDIKVSIHQVPADKEQRAYAHRESIHITPNNGAGTVAHELGHILESQHASRLASEYLKHRVGDESLTSLKEKFPDSNYDATEFGRKDDFEKSFASERSAYYAGKHYPDGSTEIISMGVEELYNDPVGFATRDPEYCNFIIGILDGSLR